MSDIEIEHNPSEERLRELGVRGWPIWTKEASEFPWSYDQQERCYIVEGEVVVTPDGGSPVTIGQGDVVTFPRGMSCTWHVRSPIRKHYRFE